MTVFSGKFMSCVCVISCIITISACIYASYISGANPKTNTDIIANVLVGGSYGCLLGFVVVGLILSVIDCFVVVCKNVSEYRKNKAMKKLLH